MENPDTLGGQEAARVLNAASEQIALALKESQPSIDGLGAALQKLAEALGDPVAGTQTTNVAQLKSDLARAVTSLQFYDRMTQHLTHVREYLADSASQIGAESGLPDEPWATLHQKLSARLLSETHRMYLGKNFPAGYLSARSALSRDARGAASPGDIDLF
jgi:hypothetical protein